MKQSKPNHLTLDRLSGKLIREIREAKGYTQKYVSQGTMRQSTYSKIEREETEPSASKLFLILDRLEMTPEEFLFIQGNYTHTKKGNIMYKFINQKYNLPHVLKELKAEVDEYLKENDDAIIKDIQSIYKGLIIFSNTSDIKLTRQFVEPVWRRIEAFDEWRLTELYLVNNILYLFSAESAIHIANRAIQQLQKYTGFQVSTTLRFNFKFNLVYLFMDNQQYDRALSALDDLIPDTKELKKHDMLAVCYVRKGIALLKSGEESGQELIDKGLFMLEVIEELELKRLIEQEMQSFLK